MVGITVGLVTVLIITQTMSLFQGGRNTIVGGTSAQENGLFAMQIAATDIRSTGAGYYSTATTNAASLQSCTNVCSFYGSGTGGCSNGDSPTGGSPMASVSGNAYTGASYHLKTPLFPVIIEDRPSGVTAAIPYGAGSDILTVRSASRFIGAIPTPLRGSADMSASANLTVHRTFGFTAGDLALIADGDGNCTVFEVTGINANDVTLGRTTSSFNPASFVWPDPGVGGKGKTFNDSSNAMVYNLGSNTTGTNAQGVTTPGVVEAREYSISGNGTTMQLRQYGAVAPGTTPLSMADGIVALRAQYGVAADATTPTVTTWVGTDSGSAWTSTWAPGSLTQANARRIRAIRILVVARAGNREATEVTAACGSVGFTSGPCPSGGANETDLTLPAINLSGLQWATADEWKHYRYKTYLTVVPIRNILWNGPWSFQGQ